MSTHSLTRLDSLNVSSKWISKKQDTKTMIVFTVLGLYFLIIGIILAVNSVQVQEYTTQYDATCGTSATCQVTLNVPQNMAGTVYFYYGLTNYFQNHRKYYTSKEFTQLAGNLVASSNLGECTPIVTNGQNWQTKALDGTPLDPNQASNPCGLIASTLFNDTFKMIAPNGSQVGVNESGIAWPEDLTFYKQPPGYKSIQWTNVTNEHFMVWMRPAGLGYFDKLWGIIPNGLPSGNYLVNIVNNYDVTPYQGKKYVMVATRTTFGGKNIVLTTIHLTAAFFSIVIVIGVYLYRRKMSTSRVSTRVPSSVRRD